MICIVNKRIKELRKHLGFTLDQFGEHVGLKKSTLSNIENGKNNITEQTFISICREFNVNPEWLRNGTGDMFLELDEDGIIAGWVGKVLKDKPKSFRKNVISVMSTWTEEDWDWIERQANAIIAESKKDHD